MKISFVLSVAITLSLTGCGQFDSLPFGKKPEQEPLPASAAVAKSPGTLQSLAAGQTAAALNTTSIEETRAALATPAKGGERALGVVVVALGPPAEQGIWLKSTLVTKPGKGRVMTRDGTSIAVDLLPGSGGALMSLAAYQGLKLKLTDLPEVTVFGP